MIPKSVERFSEKIMLKQEAAVHSERQSLWVSWIAAAPRFQ